MTIGFVIFHSRTSNHQMYGLQNRDISNYSMRAKFKSF